jgi:hypothetical protein
LYILENVPPQLPKSFGKKYEQEEKKKEENVKEKGGKTKDKGEFKL